MLLSDPTRFRLMRLAQSLWLRPAIYALGAVGALVLGPFLDPFVPDDLIGVLLDNAVRDLLTILASSMLAVAIFSLGTMVQAFQMAAGAATPRARPLLMQDRTAQNAISTFIGAFLFSVLGVVGLSVGLFGEGGRLALFVFAILLILLVTVTLIGWLHHLSQMGGVNEVIERVERAATSAFDQLAETPTLGCRAARGQPPADAQAVLAPRFGYIQYIDTKAISAVAEAIEGDIHIAARPGAWMHPRRPVAFATRRLDEDQQAKIAGAFVIGNDRTFEADPRYGVVVLSEIALRALSPAVNDPGTAIDVLGSLTRILGKWREAVRTARETAQEGSGEDRQEAGGQAGPKYPRLWAPPLDTRDVLQDAFGAILRDSLSRLDVALRLRRSLLILAELDPEARGSPALDLAEEQLDRAREVMVQRDVERLQGQTAVSLPE